MTHSKPGHRLEEQQFTVPGYFLTRVITQVKMLLRNSLGLNAKPENFVSGPVKGLKGRHKGKSVPG